METKRLILSIAIMMGLVAAWKLGVEHYLYPTYPSLNPANQAKVEPTTAPTTSASTDTSASATVASATGPTTSAVAMANALNPTTAQGLRAMGSDTPKPTSPLGSGLHDDPTYVMALSVDPVGAGIDSVTLNKFFHTSEQKDLYEFQKPLPNSESATRPLASSSVTIDGKWVDLSNLNWIPKSADSTTVTYTATITEADKPVLEIDKAFEVFPANTNDGRDGYEIRVAQNFKNLGTKPITVKSAINGPTPPARENDRSDDRQFMAGYDDGYSEVKVLDTAVTEFSTSKPTKDLVAVDKRPLLWVGAGGNYFASIVRPEYAGQPASAPIKIGAVLAKGWNLDAPADDHNASLSIETTDFKLNPAESAPFNLRVFFGPKQRDLLKNAYYSKYPLSYDNTLVTSGGMCGFLTFGWLINLLYGILWFFHAIFRDWGLAIIGLVCLVRLILHPITKKSQVNMMSMGKMGPEIERLKKKYGDNKDELNKAMMQVYKEQGFTPILGCLPMFLQMPIWIALWSALQSTFDLRQAGFLRFGWLHLTWIKDLSHPDALISFGQPFSLLFFTIHGINVLPVLLGVVSYIQYQMQPVPANQTPEQEQQRKMMKWMVLLFPVMLYAAPSGLNLYILTSTTIGIFENKIIRKHIKEKEEAEKAGRIIIDAKPTRAGRRKKDDDGPGGSMVGRPGAAPKKPGGVMGWIADLSAKAEEIRREAERKSKDRA